MFEKLCNEFPTFKTFLVMRGKLRETYFLTVEKKRLARIMACEKLDESIHETVKYFEEVKSARQNELDSDGESLENRVVHTLRE